MSFRNGLGMKLFIKKAKNKILRFNLRHETLNIT